MENQSNLPSENDEFMKKLNTLIFVVLDSNCPSLQDKVDKLSEVRHWPGGQGNVVDSGNTGNVELLLNRLVRLTAMALIDGKVQRDQIRILGIAGLGRLEIAEMVGTTPNTVSVELSKMKQKGKNTKTAS
jgi:hypothetical protein